MSSRAVDMQGRLDIENQCRGFLELAKEAVGHLVSAIFADTAFAELFHKLYCSEEWQSGVTTQSILATLGDYFDDYETLIEPSWFKRCGHGLLHVCPARFLCVCVHQT